MQREDVADAQQRFERVDANGASVGEVLIGDVWIERRHAHAECRRESRHPRADLAEADDAEAVVTKLVA